MERPNISARSGASKFIFHQFFWSIAMQQDTLNFSLHESKSAKSTFFKTVLLSISILALGSASAYAEKTNSTNTKSVQLKLVSVPGQGDSVVSGNANSAAVASGVTINLVGDDWVTEDFNQSSSDAAATCLAVLGEKTCLVEVNGKVVPAASLAFDPINAFDPIKPTPSIPDSILDRPEKEGPNLADPRLGLCVVNPTLCPTPEKDRLEKPW
jgi:hypothetical protein